jgi:DnaK suppressor protein
MPQQATSIEGQKEYFKSLLHQKLDEAIKEAKASSGGVNNSAWTADFIDQASMETDSALAFHIRERDSKLARKIKETLAKLENGTFGICEECGRQISEGRLKARPIARLCIKCKEKQEYEERLRGL